MSRNGLGIRYILYGFYLILTFGLIIGLVTSSSYYRILLLSIYCIVSLTGFYLTRNTISFKIIINDLNPKQIIKKRKEKKLVQLQERKKQLQQKLEEKTHLYNDIVSNISSKFEKKRHLILKANAEFNQMLTRDRYFSKYDHGIWKRKWQKLEEITELYFSLTDIPITYEDQMKELHNFQKKGEQLISTRNGNYVQQELEKHVTYFDTFEQYPLTLKQREAIIIDEHRNLVLAGPGTGKTSTIIGKTGYLLRREIAKPEEILLLSFGRDPKNEMINRLQDRFGLNLNVYTFHSLGMKVIAEAKDEKPSVSILSTDSLKLQHFIGQVIENNRDNKDFIGNLNYFFLSQTDYKSLWDFKTLGEYYSNLRENDIRSLKGDLVKSYEELEIANWLYLNGIEYEYEVKYEYRTANKIYGQYTPDFYLPEYDIYIEHFGIDRSNNTAPCVPGVQYLQEIAWKRGIHKQHETELIETYSFERMEGNLTEKLLTKLQDHSVEVKPISQDEIFNKLNELGYVQPITGLLATFLNLYKSSIHNITTLKAKAKETDNPERNKAFLEVFHIVGQAYEQYLIEHDEIDFNDMINKATEYLASGRVQTGYRYVLVDEFQDISQSRNRFLLSILNQNPECKLLCVGDDWQSIYRFTGSDLNIMTDFEEYHPYSASMILDQTFRFNNQLCDFSKTFILKNHKQLPKELVSLNESDNPSVTVIQTVNQHETLNNLLTELNENGGSVFILGRYNHDDPNLNYDYERLTVEFLTAHRSKGTQADYVIIIGLRDGKMGFPCQITDDPVLNMVLSKEDAYPHAEERRLFYVALTRAKNHVYLISNRYNVSDFINEILNEEYYFENRSQIGSDSPKCPRCDTGDIVSRYNEFGRFYACDNYPYCEYIAPSCPVCISGYLFKEGDFFTCSECGYKAPSCPECREGIKVLRKGQYSDFYGCTNYPDCTYTQSLRRRNREPIYTT